MKTPSSLPLLILLAALPAAAEVKPGDRCDTAFLEKVAHDFGAGAVVTDADRIISKSANGMTIPALKPAEPKTCDAATWRHLADGSPVVWRNADAKKYWDAGNAGLNASLLLIVNDFYTAVDPKAAAVLAAADAVIEAGAQLGVVTTADGVKSLSELLKGASGGQFGALKPKTVTAVEAGKQTANLPPDQIGTVLRKLLDEKGAAKAGGSAVMTFRLAVLALDAEIGRLGASNEAVVKRAGTALPAVKDFTPGLPKDHVAQKADKATALDDAKFGVSLAALIGAGATPALDSAAPRAGSLLEPIDLGLRNLIAIRAAQVEQIVAAAKTRLSDGKSITDVEVAARAAGGAKSASNPLAAAVFEKMAKTPEYARLDALYENNKRDQGDAWVNSATGKQVFEERKKMQDAALSARIEKAPDGTKSVVYTQGGKTTALGSLVPSSVEKNPDDAAEIITQFILEGTVADAKYQGVVSAIGGAGQPGKPLNTGLTSAENDLGKTAPVPPALQKIKDGSAGCESPKDLVRNDYETYAARKRSAAADMAGDNVKSRNDVEKKRLEQLEASAEACKKKKEDAQSIKQDYFDDAAVAKAAREKALGEAEAWCAADKKAIEDAAQAKISDLATHEAGDRDPAKLRAQADADLAAAFGVAITASIDSLRKDYTTPGNKRITCNPNQGDCTEKENFKLTEMTHGSPRLTVFTGLWFATEWPTDKSKQKEAEAAIAECSKALGLGDADKSPSYHNPEDPDNVDNYCKVNERITKYIREVKGMNKPVP